MTRAYQEEASQLRTLCENLREQSRAKGVYLIDTDGQLLEARGELKGIDTTALAALTAAYNASATGIFRLLRERPPTNQLLEGSAQSLFFSIVARKLIIGVVFDNRTNLGLVRIRTKKVCDELLQLLAKKISSIEDSVELPSFLTAQEDNFEDISHEDIDRLFED